MYLHVLANSSRVGLPLCQICEYVDFLFEPVGPLYILKSTCKKGSVGHSPRVTV